VLLLISLLVAVPLALLSIVKQLFVPPEVQSYVLEPAGRGIVRGADQNAVRVTITAIDETKKTATLQLSAFRPCSSLCPAVNIQFFALDEGSPQRAGPPSATVKLAEGATVLMEKIDLPIRGMPNLYPFDQYRVLLGSAVALDDPDAGIPPALAAQTSNTPISVESEVPRFVMLEPDVKGQDLMEATTFHPAFQHVVGLRFYRPLHLLVLTCLLVALIAAAAVLSVTTEPLRRLVVGVGSIILGVWGIRSVLTADAPSVNTSVDLLLSGVILILLYGITIRLLLVWRREGWDGLRKVIQDR
jgi:hypothetical protein